MSIRMNHVYLRSENNEDTHSDQGYIHLHLRTHLVNQYLCNQQCIDIDNFPH